MLRDVSQLDTKVKLFGEWVDFPICVAPTAMQCMAHCDGEAATARGKVYSANPLVIHLINRTERS